MYNKDDFLNILITKLELTVKHYKLGYKNSVMGKANKMSCIYFLFK